MIRKAFPRFVLPLAFRAVGSNATTLNLNIYASLQRDGSFFKQSHSFSVAANGIDLVDSRLRKVLRNEIKSHKINLKNSQVNIPDSTPFEQVFKFDKTIMQLRCKCADECINIIIRTYDLSLKEIGYNYDDYSCKDKQEMKAQPTIPVTVSVQKSGIDEILVFEITISPQDITILRFYFGDDDQKKYYFHEGPKFSELGNELQQSLYKYLEVRGITSDIFSFLPKYIAAETFKTNIRSLKELREFIKK